MAGWSEVDDFEAFRKASKAEQEARLATSAQDDPLESEEECQCGCAMDGVDVVVDGVLVRKGGVMVGMRHSETLAFCGWDPPDICVPQLCFSNSLMRFHTTAAEFLLIYLLSACCRT